ncbi:MAG: hypothetical protein HW412_146 [Bacteroidetes bacterium]|nr:hypothetical protein [Bacteroidota bacterium]
MLCNQFVILSVCTNPDPENTAINAESAVAIADADRP